MKVTECLNTEHGVFLTQLDVLERMLNDEAPPVLARSGPCAWRPETAVPPSGVAKAPPGVPSRSSDDQPIASWTPRARERTLGRNGESTAVLELFPAASGGGPAPRSRLPGHDARHARLQPLVEQDQ